jgi:hypothetical protein
MKNIYNIDVSIVPAHVNKNDIIDIFATIDMYAVIYVGA